jgi:hypothetical protein
MSESTNLSRTSGISGPPESTNGLERPNSTSAVHLAYQYSQREDEQGSHLFDYWRIIRKHLWLIIGVSILIPTLVAIYLIRRPDIYQEQFRNPWRRDE